MKPSTLSTKSHSKSRRKFLIDHFRKSKSIAIVTGLSMIAQLVMPLTAHALTAGPTNPDFSSFEPVATTNMVNEFTGQFVYNLPVIEIPGASGGGYALSLSYHSGDGPESEASWVGNGWTLNPGSISRNKRGLPDDYKGNNVTYYNDMPKNWTVAVSPGSGAEVFSGTFGIGFSVTASYNNYKGFQVTHSLGLSALKGIFSLGINYSEGDVTFSPRINPSNILSYASNLSKKNNTTGGSMASRETSHIALSGIGKAMANSAEAFGATVLDDATNKYISYLLSDVSSPYNITKYNGDSYSGYVSFTGDPPPCPIGFSGSINISYTEQKNVGEQQIPSYGYMYAGNAGNNESEGSACMEDYTLENPGTFTQRDIYSPIPFSSPDAFFVSGEGTGGGFRMYNDRVGIFSPNYTQSHTGLHYFGVDIHAGLDWGAGGEALISGEHKLTVHSSWAKNNVNGDVDNGNTDQYRFLPYDYVDTNHLVSENMSLRFNNDLGGDLTYHKTPDKWVEVDIGPNGEPKLEANANVLRKGGQKIPGNNRRNGRASYIGYHTNHEIKTKLLSADSNRAFAYEHDPKINSLAGRDASTNNDLDNELGEVSVVNESGSRYVYGLPVYTVDEKSMQHTLNSTIDDRYVPSAGIGFHKVGEEYNTPYPSSYLLTEITTPDYIDANLNGPDTSDLGGYTKFSYKRYLGNDDKNQTSGLYKWRIPYNGVYYKPLRFSDNIDDMGAYQSGYKEIYYLDTIDTKTHYAVFLTSDRSDGIDAPASDEDAAHQADWKNSPLQGTHHLQKLDKILLYAKATHPGDPDRLIKTVNFTYDYSSWPKTPNSTEHGKLTLKKVWFEYNGVANAFISPYQFEYTYPTSVAYPSQYQYIQDEMTGLNETIDYDPYVDCWGNYQYAGKGRRNRFQNWRSQKWDSGFDPGAWQLKRIILPSGGEIHVQYEQNTYSNVQNMPACAMAPLHGDPEYLAKNMTYTIDPADIGVTDHNDINDLVDSIRKFYNVGSNEYPGNKLYFKFFYTLMHTTMETIGSCNGDFIDGYFGKVASVTNVADKIVITADGTPSPRTICRDYIKHEIGGRLYDGSCTDINADLQPAGDSTSIKQLGQMMLNKVLNDILGRYLDCLRLDPDNSYLRIPVKKKYAGGIRVKRLMMYNPGVDAHNPTLFGTEYVYDNAVNGSSYGVATNEPPENREENPFVNFLKKRIDQTWTQKALAGKDRERFEGQMGLSCFPGASVGYSKVIKKNIYQSEKTGTGYTVVDYYTSYDYPVTWDIPRNINRQDKNHLHIGIFSYEIDQGMRGVQTSLFSQNQMNGQLKAITDYPGIYDPVALQNGTAIPISSKSYDYFKPGEQIPMYDYKTWAIYYDLPGKEQDITIDRRCVEDYSEETRLTFDFTIGVLLYIEIPWPIGFPLSSHSNMRLNTMSVSKIEHYPAILKSVTAMKDGYKQTTTNIAFDPLTTRPVVTQTYDGYDDLALPGDPAHNGKYTTYDVPASSQYQAMGQKAWNERFVWWCHNPTFTNVPSTPYYVVAGVNPGNMFNPGDLVAIHNKTSLIPDAIVMAHVLDTSGSNIEVELAKSYYPSAANNTIPSLTGIFKIEVVRSGYTNQLNSSMKGLTEYGNTLTAVSLSAQLIALLNNKIFDLLHSNVANENDTIDIASFGPILGLTKGPTGTVNNCPSDAYIQKVILYKGTGAGLNGFDIAFYPSPTSPYLPGFFEPPMNLVTGAPSFYTTSLVLGPSYVPAYGVTPPILGCWFSSDTIPTTLLPEEGTGVLGAIKICSDANVKRVDIVRAEATTYKDSWDYDILPFGFDTSYLDPYEKGIKGKWRPYQTYVYRDTVVKASHPLTGQRVYKKAGTTPFILGDWSSIMTILPDNWIKTNQVEAYNYNGNSVEEYDAEHVYSAAKYGYHGILPYLVAQNAKRNSVLFESFENLYGSYVEDRMVIDPTRLVRTEHSGYYGYFMDTVLGHNTLPLTPLNTDPTVSKGMLIRVWAKIQGAPPPSVLNVGYVAAITSTVPLNYVARCGEWALYEARWYNNGWSGNVTFTIQNATAEFPQTIVIDDVKVQPLEAKQSSYVYDTKTYKLSAVLDDQHFATFYQYNGEGKLVRKIAETIRGLKPVEESQYHLPETPR